MRLIPAARAATSADRTAIAAAPVADPLWMLACQERVREWEATDGGSAVAVRLTCAVTELRRGGAPVTAALRAQVEAEPLCAPAALTDRSAVQYALELVRLVREWATTPDDAATAVAALLDAYPFQPAATWGPWTAYAGTVPATAALYADLVAGDPPAVPPLPADPARAVEVACRAWRDLLAVRVGSAPSGSPPVEWSPDGLEYRFSLETATTGGGLSLFADEYDGGGLDWYAFDRSAVDPGRTGGPEPVRTTVEAVPAPVTYAGMPARSQWECESGHVNLELLDTTGSPAAGLLAEFARHSAAGWLLVPLDTPDGLLRLESVEVVDTFGSTTPVPSVTDIDAGRGAWRLWETWCPGPDGHSGMRVLLPPAAEPLQGPVLEDVLLARDEPANLAWVIERITVGVDGEPVDRYQRYLRLRPADDPAFAPGRSPAGGSYRLGTTIADYWYPLIAASGAAGEPTLALAAVPEGARPVDDTTVRGSLVPHGTGTLVADSEVPREGSRLTRRDRLVTGPGGSRVWRARTRTPGVGEASSGLRFDTVR